MIQRKYKEGAELDPLVYDHRVDGVLVDFTQPEWTGYTMACAPYATGVPITTGGFPKTTGITELSDGVQVDWSATPGNELDGLAPGRYVLQLRATRNDNRHLDFADVLLIIEPSLVA